MERRKLHKYFPEIEIWLVAPWSSWGEVARPGHSSDPGLSSDPALAGLADLPVCRVSRDKNRQSAEKRGKRYKLASLLIHTRGGIKCRAVNLELP